MSDNSKNNSDKQNKTETPRPNPAKNVHSPSLPMKSQYTYNPSNMEKRDKE